MNAYYKKPQMGQDFHEIRKLHNLIVWQPLPAALLSKLSLWGFVMDQVLPSRGEEERIQPLVFSGKRLCKMQSPNINAVISKSFCHPLLLPICILQDGLLEEVRFSK